jgi:hypothetical protein
MAAGLETDVTPKRVSTMHQHLFFGDDPTGCGYAHAFRVRRMPTGLSSPKSSQRRRERSPSTTLLTERNARGITTMPFERRPGRQTVDENKQEAFEAAGFAFRDGKDFPAHGGRMVPCRTSRCRQPGDQAASHPEKAGPRAVREYSQIEPTEGHKD